MKKILVTRKLLKSNEERISKLWNVNLNSNDEIYSENELIEFSKDCDGILWSIVDQIDKTLINKFTEQSDRTRITYKSYKPCVYWRRGIEKEQL